MSKIPYDTTSDNIILISYPPGGLGHFVYYLLTEFAEETVKIDNSSFEFSATGNAHAVKKYAVPFTRGHSQYFAQIDSNVDTTNKKIVVVIDRGFIDNEYVELTKTFPKAKIVRMVLDPKIYNIVAAMIATKSTNAPISLQLQRDYSGAGKFTPLNHSQVVNVSIQDLILDPFETFYKMATDLGLTVINSEQLHNLIADWRRIHKPYFIDLYKEFHKEHLL